GTTGKGNPMVGYQRLFGGNHRPAGLERRLDRRLGRVSLPAHQLDEEIDVRGPGQSHRIVMPSNAPEIVVAATLVARSRANPAEPDGRAGARRDQGLVVLQGIENAGAYRAEPGDADAQGSLHRGLRTLESTARVSLWIGPRRFLRKVAPRKRLMLSGAPLHGSFAALLYYRSRRQENALDFHHKRRRHGKVHRRLAVGGAALRSAGRAEQRPS